MRGSSLMNCKNGPSVVVSVGGMAMTVHKLRCSMMVLSWQRLRVGELCAKWSRQQVCAEGMGT